MKLVFNFLVLKYMYRGSKVSGHVYTCVRGIDIVRFFNYIF